MYNMAPMVLTKLDKCRKASVTKNVLIVLMITKSVDTCCHKS